MKKSIKIWLAVTGILLLVLGVICICNPAETLFASAWMIGALTLASGIFGLAFTLETQAFIPNSGTRMLSSLLQLFLGMFFLFHNVALTASLPIVFAFWLMIEGVILAITAFDYRKAGFGGWWFICLLGIGAVVLGYFGLKNPITTGKTLSWLIGIGIILSGCARIIGLIGISKFEKLLKEF